MHRGVFNKYKSPTMESMLLVVIELTSYEYICYVIFVHDPLTTTSKEETGSYDSLEILKHLSKISRKS